MTGVNTAVRVVIVAELLLIGAGFPAVAAAQAPPRGRGMMHDAAHHADMQGIHALFEHRQHIRREVTLTADGIDTLTESDDPAVTLLIQSHVAAMTARVREARPIHQRDPLFRELFRHTDQIVMRHETTARGVRVVETSSDPYVARLIQAHAEVVSAFIANGHAEAMKNHPVPAPPK